MAQIRISVPFTYEGAFVPPRKRNEHQRTFVSSEEILLPTTDRAVERLVTCSTAAGDISFHKLGDRILRPVLGPSGEPLDAAGFAALVEDPATDFGAWADYPFPRTVTVAYVRDERLSTNRNNVSKPKLSRRSPREGIARDQVEVRDWIGDDKETRALHCHAAASRLVLAEGIVMAEDDLPSVEFDLEKPTPSFHVRTTSQSAETAKMAGHERTSYGATISTKIVRIPLADVPILVRILEKSDPEAAGKLAGSVSWEGMPPPVGNDIELLRTMGGEGVDDFVRGLGTTYVNGFDPPDLRHVAAFMEAADEQRAGTRTSASVAQASLDLLERIGKTKWRGPNGTTVFLLRLAVGIEILMPAASAKADEAAFADLVI